MSTNSQQSKVQREARSLRAVYFVLELPASCWSATLQFINGRRGLASEQDTTNKSKCVIRVDWKEMHVDRVCVCIIPKYLDFGTPFEINSCLQILYNPLSHF